MLTCETMLQFRSWVLAHAATASFFGGYVNAECYSRDGVLANESAIYTGPELLSCGQGTNNCCLANEKCGSNLLCTDNGRGYARQYCADPSWVGCSQLSPETQKAGLAITSCSNNIWCYSQPLDSCCSNGPRYFIDPATGEVKNESLADSTAEPKWWKVDSASILAATASAASSQVSVQTTSSFPSSTPTSSPSSTPTPSSTSTAPPTPEAPRGPSVAASAGIGIGCGVAAIVAGLLVWLFLRERRKRRVLQQQIEQSSVVASSTMYGGPMMGGSDKYPASTVYASMGAPYADYVDENGGVRQELDGGRGVRAEMG